MKPQLNRLMFCGVFSQWGFLNCLVLKLLQYLVVLEFTCVRNLRRDLMPVLLLMLCSMLCFSVADEEGIHILDDGNFYYEVDGLPEVDPEEDLYPLAKKASRVKFSTSPVKVLDSLSQY